MFPLHVCVHHLKSHNLWKLYQKIYNIARIIWRLHNSQNRIRSISDRSLAYSSISLAEYHKAELLLKATAKNVLPLILRFFAEQKQISHAAQHGTNRICQDIIQLKEAPAGD